MQGTSLIVGIDGSAAGEKALAFAKRQAKLIGDCRLTVCYVIEWSPFSFQTAEENEQRHRRREEEMSVAQERVIDPAVKSLKDAGLEADGLVRHGDVADILERLAVENRSEHIIVGRVGQRGLRERLFGGVTGRLVAGSSVPVTIVP